MREDYFLELLANSQSLRRDKRPGIVSLKIIPKKSLLVSTKVQPERKSALPHPLSSLTNLSLKKTLRPRLLNINFCSYENCPSISAHD